MNVKKFKKPYVNLKEVRDATSNVRIIKCRCGKEHESFVGSSPELYKEFANERNWKPNKILTGIEKYIYYCNGCGYIFSEKELEKSWINREELALVCPKCEVIITKTNENKSFVGYECPNCHSVLEYIQNLNHGTGKVKLISTTDYFHGKCPNCKSKNDENYEMMVLQGEIIVGKSKGCKGRLKIPLECQHCGYRDLIKIATPIGKGRGIKVIFE